MTVNCRLPAQPTLLIGRDAEVEGAALRLMRPEVRLLTILGTGGVGKTRLAIAVAERVAAEFRDGVTFVDLARIHEPSELLTAIAETLGLRDGVGAATDQLQRYVEHRHMLLLLDNFEHLLNAASNVSNLLMASDHLTLLVTSREPLHLRWEHQFLVRPLALPRVNQSLSPDELGQVASLALFVERARAAQPNFHITHANTQTVQDICRRLDGLPLAIELAAARLAILTPRALLARLERRLEVLTGGACDLPSRHQTLRAAIAASYDMLSSAEQRLFRRLGVFVGGASTSAIARVCTGASTLAGEELDSLESLVAKNLLRVMDEGNCEPRFSMLETIRDFAIECLTANGELDDCVRQHAAYFLELAESADPEATPVVGPAVSSWLEPIECELDNVRAALHRSTVELQDGELSLRLTAALWPFWHVRSRFVQGTTWLQRALALSSAPTPTRAKALRGLGHLALRQNDCALAARANDAALEIVTALGDEQGVARSLHGLALVAMRNGDFARARSLLEQALSMHRRLGNTAWQALLLNFLGEVALAAGEQATAAGHFEASLALRHQLGDRWGIPQVLANLGALAAQRQDFNQAQTLYVDSLRRMGQLGSKHGIADCLEGLAIVAASTQRLYLAACLASAAVTLRDAIGVPLPATRKVDLERVSQQVRLGVGEDTWRAALQVGAHLSVEQALELVMGPTDQPGSTGLRAPNSHAPFREAAGEPLTVREREVALLVAAGLSNPQIAERLVISRETAAVHVKHILSKLGFNSRTQIAAWVGGLRRP
jgi:predicted ATPase/DNA-binding CsgD family transcriptional regulator